MEGGEGPARPEELVLRPRPPALAAPPDVAAPPADAETTPSGLAYKVLTPGTGAIHPGLKDTVTAHQTGWTKTGVMFDSSVSRGKPITFRVDSVIPGWREVLQKMVAGEKVRAWVPAKLAYGDAPPGAPGVERGATPWGDLVFDIELLDVQPAPDAQPIHSAR
jgi:FKBP-type peptidyl-prolyl cis-trans isomerase